MTTEHRIQGFSVPFWNVIYASIKIKTMNAFWNYENNQTKRETKRDGMWTITKNQYLVHLT